MANALMLKWEADAKRRGINRLLDNATSSEPGATGPVYPQPDQGPGGTSDFKTAATNFGDYNASLAAQPGRTTGDEVNAIKAGMKADGRDQPNTTELLKLAALVPLEMVQQAINATIMGATAPKRAASLEMPMTDPATGHSSDDAMQSGLALTGLMSSGSFAGAPEGALASGATRKPMPTFDPDYMYHVTGKDRLVDIQDEGKLSTFDPSHGTEQNVWPDGKAEPRSYWSAEAPNDSFYNPDHGPMAVVRAKKDALPFQKEKGTPDYYLKDHAPAQSLEFLDSDGAWKPVQANSGSKEAALLADKASQPALYSHAARVVDSLPTTKAPANQWLATLKNKGVKDEELEALNLPTGNELLTKDQLKAHIDANTPQLDEVVKGGPVVSTMEDTVKAAETAYLADHPGANLRDAYDNDELDSYIERARDESNYDDATGDGRKYSQYQLPGGENYREVLVTKPRAGELSAAEEAERRNLIDAKDSGYPLSPTDARRLATLNDQLAKASSDPGTYRSSHWDEPNVLGHIRMNDRYIPDADAKPRVQVIKNDDGTFRVEDGGEVIDDRTTEAQANIVKRNMESVPDSVGGPKAGLKTLHAEEFQSDWHQQGKKNGYKSGPVDTTGWKVNRGDLGDGSHAVVVIDPQDNVTKYYTWNDNGRGDVAAKGRDDASLIAEAAQNAARIKDPNAVPDAPFKKSWPDLLFKKFVRRAVDEGYDAISWTDGATQADRYDLSRQVAYIDVSELKDTAEPGERHFVIQGNTGVAASGFLDKNGTITKGYDGARDKVGKPLTDLVGKEVADKMMAVKGESKLTGVDLKVGGEGMKAFYDQELPRRAKKILGVSPEKKKLGPSEGSPKLTTQDETDEFDGRVAMAMEDWHDAHPNATDDEIEAAEDAFVDKFTHSSGATVHFIRLTPEIKERVKKGFPLFSTGVPLPTTSDDQNTQRVIRLIKVPHDPFSGEKK